MSATIDKKKRLLELLKQKKIKDKKQNHKKVAKIDDKEEIEDKNNFDEKAMNEFLHKSAAMAKPNNKKKVVIINNDEIEEESKQESEDKKISSDEDSSDGSERMRQEIVLNEESDDEIQFEPVADVITETSEGLAIVKKTKNSAYKRDLKE